MAPHEAREIVCKFSLSGAILNALKSEDRPDDLSDEVDTVLLDHEDNPHTSHVVTAPSVGVDSPSSEGSRTTPDLSGQRRKQPSAARISAKKAQSKRGRQLKRKREAEENPKGQDKVRQNILMRHLKAATSTTTKMIPPFPVASTGWVGLRDGGPGRKVTYSLNDLTGPDSKFSFELNRWDGRTAEALKDKNGRIFAVLVGSPGSGGPTEGQWADVHKDIFDAMKTASQLRSFAGHPHRRGRFSFLTTGISHGNGRTVPGNVHNLERDAELVSTLLENKAVRRLSGHISASFETWAPLLYTHYRETMDKILEHHPNLQMPFQNSVFPAATFNLGPETVCFKHRDWANLPFGWCAITAIGDFGSATSGHLVLWELGLVIEFPPGSTIMIPSACIGHSNIRIQPGETRMSFTQYAAGSLFRWVEYGFRNESDLDPIALEREVEQRKTRWKKGFELFSTLPEIVKIFKTRLEGKQKVD